MTTIFTLTEITVNSKSRYPVRKHPLPPGIAEGVPPHKTSAESAARQIESKIRRNDKTLWTVIGDWRCVN